MIWDEGQCKREPLTILTTMLLKEKWLRIWRFDPLRCITIKKLKENLEMSVCRRQEHKSMLNTTDIHGIKNAIYISYKPFGLQSH